MYLSLVIPASTWYLYHLIEYYLHKLGHNRNYGSYIYKIHTDHHKIHYPISKLMDTKPYRTGYTYSIPDGMFAYGPPFIVLLSSLYFCVDICIELSTYVTIVFELLLLAYLSDYIHTEIHTDGSWLEKYYWFKRKRELHLLHHKKVIKNMNIIDHTFDKVNDSYKE